MAAIRPVVLILLIAQQLNAVQYAERSRKDGAPIEAKNLLTRPQEKAQRAHLQRNRNITTAVVVDKISPKERPHSITPNQTDVHNVRPSDSRQFSNDARSRSTYSLSQRNPSDDFLLVRPNAGRGADEVHFAMIAKNFYGAELKRNRFSIDIVLSLTWNDSRVTKLIPHGLDELTLAWDQALERLWMPGIVVANRDINDSYEKISASVTIFRSGKVLRVERAHARCMKKFMLEEYPFDRQDMFVEVVSSKYMSKDVVLIPNETASDVQENIWGLYLLSGWQAKSFEDRDGDLVKSRGYLVIHLQRTIGKYFDDHLVPSAISLAISWAVFYFPFGTNPFITPRLALSILALLTFTNLMIRSTRELPGPAPFNWNDLFNQQIQVLMFVTIVINISSEIMWHQFQWEWLAKRINNEAKIFMPVCSIINIVIILSAGRYKWVALETATHATKAFLAVVLAWYFGHVMYVVYDYGKQNDWVMATQKPELLMAGVSSHNADDPGDDGDCDDGCDGV